MLSSPPIILKTIEKIHISFIGKSRTYKTKHAIIKSVSKMFNVAIFACFVLANSVSSLPAAQNEAFIELQQAVLKLQLAAQAAAFKAEVGVKNSPLQEVGLSIVSHHFILVS